MPDMPPDLPPIDKSKISRLTRRLSLDVAIARRRFETTKILLEHMRRIEKLISGHPILPEDENGQHPKERT